MSSRLTVGCHTPRRGGRGGLAIQTRQELGQRGRPRGIRHLAMIIWLRPRLSLAWPTGFMAGRPIVFRPASGALVGVAFGALAARCPHAPGRRGCLGSRRRRGQPCAAGLLRVRIGVQVAVPAPIHAARPSPWRIEQPLIPVAIEWIVLLATAATGTLLRTFLGLALLLAPPPGQLGLELLPGVLPRGQQADGRGFQAATGAAGVIRHGDQDRRLEWTKAGVFRRQPVGGRGSSGNAARITGTRGAQRPGLSALGR